MPTTIEPNHARPGLTDREKKTLDRLAGKDKITDFEKGQLRAFAYFGDLDDARRAEKILAKKIKKGKS